MAIKVTIADTRPALVYDNFFLSELKLTQKEIIDDSITPDYTLKVTYRMYAVDGNGERHYKTKVDTIEIDDYAAVAYEKALSGDMDLANAATAIEHALAKIIEDQRPELGTTEVV